MTSTSGISQEEKDAIWSKDTVPLSVGEGKYETINTDSSYESVTPEIRVEAIGEFQEKSGDLESITQPVVDG